MQITLTALKSLHNELGGSAQVWFGYSPQHDWLLLDRTLKPNRVGSKTEKLTFERFKDWSEVELARTDWDTMASLTSYGRVPMEPMVRSYLFERLQGWHETRDERAERQRLEKEAVLAAQRAGCERDNLQRIQGITPYYARDRSDALDLLRHDLKKHQAAERSRIETLVSERGIQYLVHFTPVINLPSILGNGLVPRKTLEAHGTAFCHNDQIRKEGLKEANCLSISFPNYLMLYPNIGKNLCLLALDPAILWELPCLFSPFNAASRCFSPHIELLQSYVGINALEQMFAGDRRNREAYGLLQSCTTDPQAEVLVVDTIPSSYIKGVVFSPRQSPEQRTPLLSQAAVQGIADMSETHSGWFRKRVDDTSRWAKSSSDFDIYS